MCAFHVMRVHVMCACHVMRVHGSQPIFLLEIFKKKNDACMLSRWTCTVTRENKYLVTNDLTVRLAKAIADSCCRTVYADVVRDIDAHRLQYIFTVYTWAKSIRPGEHRAHSMFTNHQQVWFIFFYFRSFFVQFWPRLLCSDIIFGTRRRPIHTRIIMSLTSRYTPAKTPCPFLSNIKTSCLPKPESQPEIKVISKVWQHCNNNKKNIIDATNSRQQNVEASTAPVT